MGVIETCGNYYHCKNTYGADCNNDPLIYTCKEIYITPSIG